MDESLEFCNEMPFVSVSVWQQYVVALPQSRKPGTRIGNESVEPIRAAEDSHPTKMQERSSPFVLSQSSKQHLALPKQIWNENTVPKHPED